MASSASSPIINIAFSDYSWSHAATLPYLPDSEKMQNTDRWEIIDPELKEGDISQGSFAISTNIENHLRYFLMMGARIRYPSEMRDYLYYYPELTDLVRYSLDSALQLFGHGLELSLEMYQDREANHERLTLYARLSSYDKNTMKIIKQIRKEYHQLFPGVSGRFLLTTDFRLPG